MCVNFNAHRIGTLGAAPSSSTMLGYITTATLAAGSSIGSTISITFPSPGVWFCSYALRFSPVAGGSTTVTRFFTSLLTTINGVSNSYAIVENCATQSVTSTQYISHSASAVISVGTFTTATIVANNFYAGGGSSLSSVAGECYLQIVRIA